MRWNHIAHNSLRPFYLAWQIKPDSADYNLSFLYELKDDRHVALLTEKLQALVRLKAHLRQTFTLEGAQLIVSIHEDLPAKINFFTSTKADFPVLEKSLVREPHVIDVESSIILNIITFSDSSSCVVLFNIHHILIDGHSLEQFILDLNRLMKGEIVETEEADTYISRMAAEPPLQDETTNALLTSHIEDINNVANNIEYPISTVSNTVDFYASTLPSSIAQKLTDLSHRHSLSAFNLLLIAWSVFAAKLFNQPYALINYPVNIRVDKSINGCLANVVPFPLVLAREDTYLSLISTCRNKMDIFKRTAKLMLNDKLRKDILLSFANSSLAQPRNLVIANVNYIAKSYSQIENSILSVKYHERSGIFHFNCAIMREVFPSYFSSSLLPRFFHFLDKLLINPLAHLVSTSITFSEEKKQILYNFNNTVAFYPHDKTVHQLFEEQVAKAPNAIAIVLEDKQFTYQQLNEKANQVAAYIRAVYHQLFEKALGPDTLIAICVEPGMEMIVGILGILKAGGAYVPIEPTYPEERVEFILKDTDSKIILTQMRLQQKLTGITRNVKRLVLDESSYLNESMKNLPSFSDSRSLAYVMYTSGTTGKPKGVMIEHTSIISLVKNAGYFTADETDTFALLADIAFDAATFQIWGALLNGSRLFIPCNKFELLSNKVKLNGALKTNNITVMLLTKTAFDQMYHLDKTVFNQLNYLLIGGEPLNKVIIRELTSSNYRPQHLINGYGPTENSTFSCTFSIEMDKIKHLKSIPIGKPMANRSCYILDHDLQPLPVGVIGILYVGGAGLARGYLNRLDLTKERFIENPFSTDGDKEKGYTRLYNTGDLARWLDDGNIEYIGRNDCQVKLRGYRIELGEIENTLLAYPGIKQSAVVLYEQGEDQHLLGYYVADTPLNEESILTYLAQNLPEYMLPTLLIHLGKLPLCINGKLDKRVLPIPQIIKVCEYVAPENEQEQLVCEAFSLILELEKVGVNDDFFKLGGNSIKVIRLVSNLQSNFNINVADVFNLKTPKKIAEQIPFVKDDLIHRLEKIKLSYNVDTSTPSQKSQAKLVSYLAGIDPAPVVYHQKPIVNVLLTGATGFLGCNLLNQLLASTNYNIFLVVRARSDKEAFERINRKFQFYFDANLENVHDLRLFVFAGDIEKCNLGLHDIDYQRLVTQTDSIIHAAALTKHYGDSNKFYSANVQATINLLNLAKLTQAKDFHYISTVSVLEEGYIMPCEQYIFTEDDRANNLETSNIYVKTKYEGEKEVVKCRAQGITGNIYRVGNLAFISSNYRTQQNIDDNAFFNRARCFINLGIIPAALNMEEISAVDLTAQAILKLFDKKELNNQVYHVFNPNLCNMSELFSKNGASSVNVVSIDRFIDSVVEYLSNPLYKELVERFLLHQGWLNEWHTHPPAIRIRQDRTRTILAKLNFEWLPINSKAFNHHIQMEIENDRKAQKNRERQDTFIS